jgi:putative oxidoreductase
MKSNRILASLVSITAILCRLILGSIFLYASIEKIIDPQEFAIAIYNYQLLPDWAINLLAVMLPWLEVLVAACLIAGIYTRGAALLASLLFLVFAVALTISLARGLDISCGCFGKSSNNVTFLYLLRDMTLLIMSAYVLCCDRGCNYFFTRQPNT